MKLLTLSFSFFLLTISFAQTTDMYPAEVANKYFSFSLKLTTETPGFTPPVSSRAFGYAGLALYEAMVPGMPLNATLVNKLPQFQTVTPINSLSQYHWPTVANNVLAAIIDSLWANASIANKDSLLVLKNTLNASFQSQITATVFNESKTFGESIANDIFQYSKTDGGHEAYNSNFPLSFVPPVGQGLWVALPNQLALQPNWGNTRPFMLANTANTIPGPPPAFSSNVNSSFYAYADQVYQQSFNNSLEQIVIAQYWADGAGTVSPPGHSLSILINILQHENASLETAAIQYAKMGMALADAFRACWKTKYLYNCLRPITYINDHIDPSWSPLVSTPPFPEYTSGHSTQSGAMKAIMESYLGTSYAFVDSIHGTNFGGPRSFNSFSEAANEAAISRLYGGIHFEFGNELGLETGEKVGANINSLFRLLSLSTNEIKDEIAVNVYPNPAQSELNIQVSGWSDYAIVIQNFMGQTVQYLPVGQNKFDVSNLESGLYVVKIIDQKSGKAVIKNFVKQ